MYIHMQTQMKHLKYNLIEKFKVRKKLGSGVSQMQLTLPTCKIFVRLPLYLNTHLLIN